MKLRMNKESFKKRMQIIADKVGGQAELARLTGITTVTINSYVLGKSDPSRERLILLAKAAGESVGWLAAGEEKIVQGSDARSCEVCNIEDNIISEIRLWLRDLVSEDPDYMPWFRMEFVSKFDKFKEWREKKRATDTMENTGTG